MPLDGHDGPYTSDERLKEVAERRRIKRPLLLDVYFALEKRALDGDGGGGGGYKQAPPVSPACQLAADFHR